MNESENSGNPQTQPSRSVLELSAAEARDFFLKHESYCSLDLPPYFNFQSILSDVDSLLTGKKLSSVRSDSPRDLDDVNYPVVHNKDGTYAWRPFQLIHPALYVSLVHQITEPLNWTYIQNRFSKFQSIDLVDCMSIPRESTGVQTDKAEQISHWWREIEQRSIELSLDFEILFETDITDCYGSIYSHSIPWALHTKPVAKDQRRDQSLIGNIIDSHIQDMSHGQTNGIPQGSVLMDFLAEMVLGYADKLLSQELQYSSSECKILRYRDDYRVFVNNPQVGNAVIKALTEIMHGLGLKLNSAKTKSSNSVITSAIKADKLAWIARKQADSNLQKHLLIIHDHSRAFPNAGSLAVALNRFYRRILSIRRCDQPIPLIAIVVDIAFRNPRTYPICAAILSRLFSFTPDTAQQQNIVERIRRKFATIPNTGLMEIWLQRITLPIGGNQTFGDKLCKLVDGKKPVELWNNSWLSWPDLTNAMDCQKIIDKKELSAIKPIIPPAEVELFVAKARQY